MTEPETRTFKCPHCNEVITMTDLEIGGMDALMSLMPGPRLLHPEGTTSCKKCEKPIEIKAILEGRYNVTSPWKVVLGLLVVAAAVVGLYFLFRD